MSTRSVTNFGEKVGTKFRTEAKIYRHSDGYPESMLPDLTEFFKTVKAQTSDTRFNDASYLAAKWVVFLSHMFARSSEKYLDFLSVGVLSKNPGDIEYEYFVDCGKMDANGFPTVTYVEV